MLVALPTGFGKSLIRFYPRCSITFEAAVGQDSVVIVVSPLSAFMRDQVQTLEGVLKCVSYKEWEKKKGKEKSPSRKMSRNV